MTRQAQRTPVPKSPGPWARKIRQVWEHLFRASWPYLAAFLLAIVINAVTGWRFPLELVLGAMIWHALLRLHEGYGWHRRGGRAAARRRRKYQGAASYRERRARLSLHATRKRAHVTRPATEHPRRLPPEELGVLIGTTVRRSR